MTLAFIICSVLHLREIGQFSVGVAVRVKKHSKFSGTIY